MSKHLPNLMTALGLAATLALPVAAKGVVEVKFVEPDKFADIGRGAFDRERVLKELGDFMRSLDKELPDGQTLKLEVLDIDLAGTIEPWRHNEIRVLRDRADWPHMTLRYTLQAGSEGATLKSGKAELADMNYMQSLRGAGRMEGDYAYEKRMVQQWLRKDLLAPDAKPRP